MKKGFLPRLLVVTALIIFSSHASAQTGSSSLSCPPNYALSIDPPPPPTDDSLNPVTPKSLSAADKLQAEAEAKADEISRWHCVPLDSIRDRQRQQPAEGHNEP